MCARAMGGCECAGEVEAVLRTDVCVCVRECVCVCVCVDR